MSNDDNNNISQFPGLNQTTSTTITLDDVIKSIAIWRGGKTSMQEKIPESIWQQVFRLMEKFPETTVLSATGISSTQYHRKLAQRSNTSLSQKKITPPAAIDFCEAKEDQSSPKIPFYKPAKIPHTDTLIVEFCRADGRIMKIHTTTDSFADLMKAFFAGE